MADLGNALLARLGLKSADAGVLLGAFLASEGEEGGPGALARLEPEWSARCGDALAQIRALTVAQRAAVLRALSRALLVPDAPAWSREGLARRLREVHPQVAAAVLSMLPAALAGEVRPPEVEPCRLPPALRARVGRAELRRLGVAEERA
jgi:hypothetical protein